MEELLRQMVELLKAATGKPNLTILISATNPAPNGFKVKTIMPNEQNSVISEYDLFTSGGNKPGDIHRILDQPISGGYLNFMDYAENIVVSSGSFWAIGYIE